MKNPNGYGTVVRLKGNRRRPYAVRKTVGWDGDNRIIKAIGYYATREEAMLALAAYNKSPYDVGARKITMAELYGRWLKRMGASGHLADGTMRSLRSAYGKCASLHGMVYAEIRAHMMQGCIDGQTAAGAGNKIRGLFIHLDKFAAELDVIDRRYADLTRVAAVERKSDKAIFSGAEVARLWGNASEPWVDTVLILLYSGWRISELLGLRRDDVDIGAGIMRGGVKTKAGKGRIVPIHSAILPLVRARHDACVDYFIERDGRPISYGTYSQQFRAVMGRLEMRHTIHETRHTFRSSLDAANANIACVNRIMGHVCGDIGLQVYTHKTIGDLRATIELIKGERADK